MFKGVRESKLTMSACYGMIVNKEESHLIYSWYNEDGTISDPGTCGLTNIKNREVQSEIDSLKAMFPWYN